MILTKRAILRAIETGHIVSPVELVQENSVNFRLGPDLYVPDWRNGRTVNLHADREFLRVPPVHYMGMEGFILGAKQFHLGTTLDVHGTVLTGDGIAYVPECRARSTTGRHGLTVALCAGVGDVGYTGRWALEIVNNSDDPVFIAIGTEIGQFVFHEATTAYPPEAYGGEDRYQKSDGRIQFLPKPFKLPSESAMAARKEVK